ncbi:recombinase family protein [Sulfurospirillum barnesii]|uniref:Site-specific recombinase, DNA invertase Pin n=1 Tax=Sulfurospirillum barnesii (strain ATCC 700032 / DSM 10660 / SES-3) TaxID=760154 RepID=I3XU29_SULBS|nr:recombinase family protein [Sulfurospirillum barnesii]AFL67453.1 site-specific recombinase, DNA invertase Pin [Sulfurospirillum barnesii SES-3]
MNIALLKNQNRITPVTTQQKQILKYAHHHSMSVDSTEIENSEFSFSLEERREFRGFLRSLNENDHLIIFDLHTFSENTMELIKIFECLLKRSISVHIADINACIHVKSEPVALLELLLRHQEFQQNDMKEKKNGRPKGRISKSKFDVHRSLIIELLEAKEPITQIAKTLHVSRTSLKDYVNSRGLKELVKAKVSLLKTHNEKLFMPKHTHEKECSLSQILSD